MEVSHHALENIAIYEIFKVQISWLLISNSEF